MFHRLANFLRSRPPKQHPDNSPQPAPTTSMGSTRTASHAGSWYSDDETELAMALDGWLDAVTPTTDGIGPLSSTDGPIQLPSPGARVIIAPHAGYSYSGRAAAWAYRALDLKHVKRVFILGPSHHHRLSRCALSQCISYETPLGDLDLDQECMAELDRTGQFDKMSLRVDEAEHSIEMHLPYIYQVLRRAFCDYAEHLPPIVPVLVGNTTGKERQYGEIFAPYIADPANAFVVSSDFCHWGPRHFGYSYYEDQQGQVSELRSGQAAPTNPTINESIQKLDMKCIKAIESGQYDAFIDILRETDNTVCGRHPIGVVMAALEHLRQQRGANLASDTEYGKFKFVRYERSKVQTRIDDSSVSYASAFAVV